MPLYTPTPGSFLLLELYFHPILLKFCQLLWFLLKTLVEYFCNRDRGQFERKSISKLPFASASKQVFVEQLSCEIKFDQHENEPVVETRFHMNDFVRRLIST